YGQETEVARLSRERNEALEQLTAASEVLKVISSLPGELGPVFQSMLENATRLCEANLSNFFLYELGVFRNVAQHGQQSKAYSEFLRQAPVVDIREHPNVPLARLAATKEIIHIADLETDPSYDRSDARIVGLLEAAGARTLLFVPVLRLGELVGAFSIYRREVRPFTDKQIELVKNFAAQAVIAIENARLLNELRQRTTGLTQSLEEEAGAAEVLRVISSSPGKVEPVFESLLANAKHLCGAKFGALFLREGDAFRTVAVHGSTPEYSEARRHAPLIQPAADTGLGRVLKTRQAVQIPDIHEVPGYLANPVQAPIVQLAGARTMLSVPMLKEEELLGVIEIFRIDVNPFTKKQVELVQSFAAQAVIAIENARLLNELRESLDRQTATSEVLSVISSSPGELGAVFDAMLVNATRLCEAKFGILFLWEGDAFRTVALHNAPPAFVEHRRREPVIRPEPVTSLGRLVATKQVDHVADMRAEK